MGSQIFLWHRFRSAPMRISNTNTNWNPLWEYNSLLAIYELLIFLQYVWLSLHNCVSKTALLAGTLNTKRLLGLSLIKQLGITDFLQIHYHFEGQKSKTQGRRRTLTPSFQPLLILDALFRILCLQQMGRRTVPNGFLSI